MPTSLARPRPLARAALLAAAALLAGAARAEAEPPPPPLVPLQVGGFSGAAHLSYRLIGWAQPGLQLGRRDAGEPIETLGKKTFLEHRLRVGGELKRDAVELRFEADLLNGLLRALPSGYVLAPQAAPAGGAPRPDLADPLRNRAWGASLSSFALRELSLRWRTPVGQLTLGATTFGFGLGMLSNPANAAPDADLGDQRFGDRVARLAFSTKPLALALGPDAPDLTVAIGLDLVLQDATASLFRPVADWGSGVVQDRAFGGILALLHKAEGRSLGLTVTRRSIRQPDSPELVAGVTVPFSTDLQVWAFDAAGDLQHALGDSGLVLSAGAEGALVAGDADRVRNTTCPGNTDATRCKVLQGGLLARAGLRAGIVSIDLLGGFASGDADPFDDRVNNFRMSRDLPVGLILFDQVLAWQSAATVRRATDPLLTNAPAAGVELLSTNGAVTNALFLQPSVKVRPLPGLQLTAALLWAVAPQPVADAWWTLKSGALTNSFGLPAGKSYGLEVDLGVDWRRELLPGLTLFAGLQGGLFVPGDAFAIDAAGATIDPVSRVKARAALSF